jgi:hypothetical protein
MHWEMTWINTIEINGKIKDDEREAEKIVNEMCLAIFLLSDDVWIKIKRGEFVNLRNLRNLIF